MRSKKELRLYEKEENMTIHESLAKVESTVTEARPKIRLAIQRVDA